MIEKRFKCVYIKDNLLELRDNEIVKVFNNERLEELLNELHEENEELKQQLEGIENCFKFSCTENRLEFDKDEIKIEDTHTELILKDGKMYISVFVPQINECFKFFYVVTGRRLMRKLIEDGDVE